MTPLEVSAIVFACLVAGALSGIWLSAALPDHHLDTPSKDVVRLGMGLIATMAALVLGLVIGSARSTFDAEGAAIRESATDILMLDRVLGEYGPETQATRDLLRRVVSHRLGLTWDSEDASSAPSATSEVTPRVDRIETQIRQLSPRNDGQRELRARALDVSTELQKTHWLALESAAETIPLPFLIVLVFWLTILFGSFGLFAPRNATVVAVLILCALSVCGSIFLILEMDHPFAGMMKVSSAPLRFALERLGK